MHDMISDGSGIGLARRADVGRASFGGTLAVRLRRFGFRLTVRRLMVAVAIVGLVIGVYIEGERRREHYARLARQHAVVRDELHKFLVIVPPSSPVEFFGDRKAIAALVGYHGRLKAKYEEAARFPWLPIEPDPPEPK